MIKDISDPIYSHQVFLVVGEPAKNIQKHYDKQGVEPCDVVSQIGSCSDASGYCLIENGLIYIVINKPLDWHDTVVHECAHAVFEILDGSGFIVDDGSKQEPFCYLQGYYVRQCVKHIEPHIQKMGSW